MSNFINLGKTPNFGRTVRTLDYTLKLKLEFSEASTQRSRGICKKNKNKLFLDDFEGVFEKKVSRFIWAKCHIKLSHAIYIYVIIE